MPFSTKERPETLVYWNGERPLHEVLLQNAKRYPNDIAILWYGAEISYGQLADWIHRFAEVLRGNGVGRGDRVALFMHNCPQYYIAHYAIQLIGAIVVPVSPAYKAMELTYQVCDMDAKVLITATGLYPVMLEAEANLPVEVVILTRYDDLLPETPSWPVPQELYDSQLSTSDLDRARVHRVVDMFQAMDAIPVGTVSPLAPVSLDDTCLLVYTSGITGRPKGAMLSYYNALYKTVTSGLANGVRKDDRIVSVMPLSHIAGMLMGVTMPIYAGSTVVLMYRFDPMGIVEAIKRSKATWWYSTTPMNLAIMALLESSDALDSPLFSLRINLCTSFGIPLTEKIAKKWGALTGGCPVYEAAYGLSETHTADTFMPGEAVKWGTNGIPVYQTELRIIDPVTNLDVSVGEQGEILIRSPGVFQGYWRNQEATDRAMWNGFLRTGDIGSLDEDGYLTFLGRLKEMIKVSGFSVFPEDVEALMLSHLSIAQVAVVGVPDPQRGEVVKAFIVLKSDAIGHVSEDEVMDWAKRNMASYKVPNYVQFIDALPMSSTGKVLRKILQQQ